jgi:prevent-host-death family protein
MEKLEQEFGIFEVKKHLSRLLNDVRNGGVITITNRGKPIAQIVPYFEQRKAPMETVMERFRKIRNAATSSGSVKDYIRKGRSF